MIDDLKALAVFAKTVEHRSFREAARKLALSPSVVSQHVTRLERKLGLPLLYRTTRHLALTPDGEQLYASARAMLDAAERGLDAATSLGSEPRGRLRITAPALLAETRFSRDLAAFARSHPKVELTLSFTERRQDLVRDGFDLALRFGSLDDSSLKARRLTEMPRVLAAAPAYVAERSLPRVPRDLDGWELIRLGVRPPEVDLVPPGKKQPVTIAFSPRIVLDSITAVREMVLAGFGAAVLPELLARAELARGRLVELLSGWRVPPVGVFAVWPGGTPRPELTLRFVDFVEARLAALFAPA
jgi:DNA-binding transcriptional LysR family regulator